MTSLQIECNKIGLNRYFFGYFLSKAQKPSNMFDGF